MAAHPATFYPQLTDERLSIIASRLLTLRHDTIRELQGPYDDNYTREGAAFGRSRNMLIQLCQSRDYAWLDLVHPGMDVTFTIDGVPCRFFRDDAENPEKQGFFRRNAVDDLFADDDKFPVMFRFAVERALTDDDEDRVCFAGYNVYQEKVAKWQFLELAPTLHSVGGITPPTRRIPPAPLELRDDEDSQSRTASDGEH